MQGGRGKEEWGLDKGRERKGKNPDEKSIIGRGPLKKGEHPKTRRGSKGHRIRKGRWTEKGTTDKKKGGHFSGEKKHTQEGLGRKGGLHTKKKKRQ